MIALAFEIHLREPLLATALEGDPNSSVSLPFIPGSLLRGALGACYLTQHPGPDLAADPTYRRLFLDGNVRYLHAYPLARLGQRTLPTPSSWKVGKGTTKPVYDLSVELADLEQPKSLDGDFCWLEDREFELYRVNKHVNVHTQRDRKMGRAIEGAGAVFQYEAIAPGEVFGAVILGADAGMLQPLLEQGSLLLGGSHSAGYGLVKIQNVRQVSDWSETPVTPTDVPAGGEIAVTLLSDVLLRDENGRYTGYLGAKTLGACLGVGLKPILERTHAQPVIVGGFNRKWGLPLPQIPAARAGSVYVFQVLDPIPADRLARLMTEGIGERRTEGFGRVAINWHSEYENPQLREVSKPPSSLATPSFSSTSAALAGRMAGRMLRRTLDRRLTERVNRLKITRSPENSQLSRLRVIARSALATQDVERIREYLHGLEETARKQFEGARIEGQSLLGWLDARLEDSPDQVWHGFGLASSDRPSVGSVQAAWSEALSREYTIRLIDGILAKAIKERKGR
jgi:CRISPR-associated protein Csx10